MAISPLPDTPTRGQVRDDLVETTDAFLAALPLFVTEANATAVEVNTARDEATAAALLAQGGSGLDLTGQGGNVVGVNAGADALEFKTLTAFSQGLFEATDAEAARTTLGVGVPPPPIADPTDGDADIPSLWAGEDVKAAVKPALNASGDAPIYACRAWVNFNGTAATIRGSGNVSSLVRNALGDYTINFATSMPDANYCFNMSASDNGTTSNQTNGFGYGSWTRGPNSCVYNTGSMRFQIGFPNSSLTNDQSHVNVSIFR